MVRSVAGNLPEQVKNNQSVNTAAGNGGQKMSQYSWFTVYVLCNVRIGNNVIVGAGSVVTHDLPDNGVYAGVPARYVSSIEDYKEKNQKLREERPRFDLIRPWYDWKNATEEEDQEMADALEDGVGFL